VFRLYCMKTWSETIIFTTIYTDWSYMWFIYCNFTTAKVHQDGPSVGLKICKKTHLAVRPREDRRGRGGLEGSQGPI